MEATTSLQERLASLKEQNLKRLTPEMQDTMFSDLQKLEETGIIEQAPKVGDKLADFSLPNQLGNQANLNELLAKGPVVMKFYRGGWCPYCNLDLPAYQAILPQIKEAGATLVAITPELPDSSLSTAEKHALAYDVLTDEGSRYAEAIKIMFTLQPEIVELYKLFELDIDKHNGREQYNMPLAATFVVDTDGTVAYSFVRVDYTERAEPADILEVLSTLKK